MTTIKSERRYGLDYFVANIPFDEFLKMSRVELLAKSLEQIPISVVDMNVQYTIRELSTFECAEESRKFQREDGQYVYKGNMVSLETLMEQIMTHSRVLMCEITTKELVDY